MSKPTSELDGCQVGYILHIWAQYEAHQRPIISPYGTTHVCLPETEEKFGWAPGGYPHLDMLAV